MSNDKFPVWKTIAIGGKTKDELLAELEAKGFKVDKYAKEIMAQTDFVTSSEPVEIDLVVVMARDFGLSELATIQESFSRIRILGGFTATRKFFSRAKELGLERCPAEVGPHLRLALTDQPSGQCLRVAMKPIGPPGSIPFEFVVENDGGERKLDGDAWVGMLEWFPGGRYAFALPRK